MPTESWWKRLFAWVKQRHEIPAQTAPPGPHRSPLGSSQAHLADCAFCKTRQLRQEEPSVPYCYPLWKCPCGAFASGAWLPDLDEVADQLLEVLAIQARVSEPCVPTDHPAITCQHYSVDKVEREMAEILTRHGCEVRIAPGATPSERLYWVRRKKVKV